MQKHVMYMLLSTDSLRLVEGVFSIATALNIKQSSSAWKRPSSSKPKNLPVIYEEICEFVFDNAASSYCFTHTSSQRRLLFVEKNYEHIHEQHTHVPLFMNER